MLDYTGAIALLQTLHTELGVERLPLSVCAERILGADLYAKIPSPPFTNSAMDGFAVRHDDTKGPLVVSGTIFAKKQSDGDIPSYQPRTCVRIMTGAPLPEWADTVIPVEESEMVGEGRVAFKTIPALGSHIRRMGEDIAPGTLLLKAGMRLIPERLMVAAAFGCPELDVLEKPRVLLVSTGDELYEPSESLPLGGIYNSSRYFLTAAVQKLGLCVDTYVTIGDDALEAGAKIASLLAADPRPTLLLTTGAVSAGEKDFIPQVAQGLGFEALFHKVAIRPGKPVFVARRGKQAGKGLTEGQSSHLVWLGLPGNAISTCVGWHFFARPLLTAWVGMPPAERRVVKLKNAVTKPEGLRCFYRAEVNGDNAWVGRNQGSAELAPSINVEAYVDLPEGMARVAADSKVEALFV